MNYSSLYTAQLSVHLQSAAILSVQNAVGLQRRILFTAYTHMRTSFNSSLHTSGLYLAKVLDNESDVIQEWWYDTLKDTILNKQ